MHKKKGRINIINLKKKKHPERMNESLTTQIPNLIASSLLAFNCNLIPSALGPSVTSLINLLPSNPASMRILANTSGFEMGSSFDQAAR